MGLRRVLVAAVLVAACASDGNEAAPAPELDGTAWTLVGGSPMVAGFPLRLSFADGSIGGHDGCNGFGGEVEISGDDLRMPEAFSSTAIGCPPAITTAAETYTTALLRVQRFAADGERLVLSGQGVELVFDPVRGPDMDRIVDATWLLDSLIVGNTTAPAGGSGGHLRLDSTGTVEGGTGCRTLAGEWILTAAGEILFPSFGADGSCAPGLIDQDGHVVTVLGDGFTAVVEGDELRVSSIGNIGLVYRRAEDAAAPAPPTAADSVGFQFDPDLTWTVVDLAPLEYVEVHAEPDTKSPVVAELASGERLVAAGIEPVEGEGESWRLVHTDADAEGWLPDRYLSSAPSGAG